MSGGLLSVANRVQRRLPTLMSIFLIGVSEVRQLEKRLHRSLKFHKMVLCGTIEAAELSKPNEGRIQDGRRCLDF